MKQSNIAKVFKALSSEQRLNLFKMICDETEKLNLGKEKNCCEGLEKAFTTACDCLDLSRSTISHHFKELQNAGLITCKRVGQSYSCMVNKDVVQEVREFLK
ncbi:MAG: helix-turn-helix transcriptional regulator [Fibrobacteria bacterium]|nr:helix-turn-helix transcriptional regulator [Fibrobacteria bacterium]